MTEIKHVVTSCAIGVMVCCLSLFPVQRSDARGAAPTQPPARCSVGLLERLAETGVGPRADFCTANYVWTCCTWGCGCRPKLMQKDIWCT